MIAACSKQNIGNWQAALNDKMDPPGNFFTAPAKQKYSCVKFPLNLTMENRKQLILVHRKKRVYVDRPRGLYSQTSKNPPRTC